MIPLYLFFALLLVGCTVASPQKQLAFQTGSKTKVLYPRFDEEVIFKCEVNDASANVTLWHRKTPFEEEIMLNPAHPGEHSKFTVHIKRLSDGGMYTCKAVNFRGQTIKKHFVVLIDTSASIHLKEIEPRPSELVSQGERASFSCVGTVGQMTWYKVQERQVGGKRRLVRIKKMPGKTERFGENMVRRILIFENVQQSDSGLYECQLVDRHMSRHKIARLTVRTAPQITHDGSSSLQIHEGDTATLPCKASGTPTPEVKWSKNGRRLSLENPRYIQREYGLDIIHARFPEDDGKYVCEAQNVLGKDAVALDVVVKVAPKMNMNGETEYAARSGRNPLSIECKVTRSSPVPNYTWTFRLGIGNSGGRWMHLPGQIEQGISSKGALTSVLNISQKLRLPPNGVTFRCEASNGEGKGVKDFIVYQV